MKKRVIVILGPTAVGKSDFAVELACRYDAPVVSCDSRQIYKEMKIGTAPPTQQQMDRCRHYFIHSHSIQQHYSAGQYEIEALELVSSLLRERDVVVMVGGSGLYADAFCYGLDSFPEADLPLREELGKREQEEGPESLRKQLLELDPQTYHSIDLSNRQRVIRALEVTISTGRPYSSFKTAPKKPRPFSIERYALNMDREILYGRINRRVDKMVDAGLVDEVRSLEPYRGLPALMTVGYREIFDAFDGKISLDEAISLIKRNTRRYAKRQVTYFAGEKQISYPDLTRI